MKKNVLKMIICTIFVVAFLAAGATVWGANGNPSGNGPGDPPPPAPEDWDFWFWRLGHLDGPHVSSQAFGISRDGKVAVGSTLVVDFVEAWRLDIDWAISTGDGDAPLYNELQVQEKIGGLAAYAASDMTVTDCLYDRWDKEEPTHEENFDWCGSLPVGTLTTGTVSYAAEWLWVDVYYDEQAEVPNYLAIPDFGGGISDMKANDVSADGIILVGTGNTMSGEQAFRADTTVVDEDLVPIPVQLTITDMYYTEQTLHTSSAQAVSADGTIIAGYGATATGNRAFVTTFLGIDETTGEAILESYVLPNLDGGSSAEAYALTVTDEGVIYVAGRSDSPKGPQACIWFKGDDSETPEIETWLVKGLGGLSKDSLDSMATGIVHRPGSTAGELMVVGKSKSILYDSEAFVWTGNPVLEPDGPYTLPDGKTNEYIGYMYDMEYILIKAGAGEYSGMGSSWVLNEATGVALNEDDTARIVGWGTSPEGGTEAWLVTGFPYDELVFTHE
jgi:uncharacterized membrane protein